jgi:glycosyltransferase domain-containing protein
MDSLVTIFIPTMNRPDMLLRLLHYLDQQNFKGHISIGDSSDDERAALIQQGMAPIKKRLNIIYRRYPGINEYRCMQDMLNTVSTPYLAYVADDDFIVPESLKQCVRFLEDNADYSIAHGRGLVFNLDREGAYGKIVQAGPYRQPRIEADQASQRLLEYLNDYSVAIFSVQRSDDWRDIYRDIHTVEDRAVGGELITCLLTVAKGKAKELDCLYLIRQMHTRRYGLPDVYDWITSPHWHSSYMALQRRLIDELVIRDGIKEEEAHQVVRQALWGYLSKGLRHKWEMRYLADDGRSDGIGARIRRAGGRLPGVRRAWRTLTALVGQAPPNGYALSLDALCNPTSPYYEDFIPVCRAVSAETMAGDG